MDWNEDGIEDLMLGGRYGYVYFFRGTSYTSDSTVVLTAEPHIQAGGSTIDVGENSAPVVTDWNDDGLPDLLVGERYTDISDPGSIRVYLNSGTPGAPLFTTYSFLGCVDGVIRYEYTVPQVIDVNGDGKQDLLLGRDSVYPDYDANILYYQNIGSSSVPVLASPIMAEYYTSNPIDMNNNAKPTLCYWNGDSVFDMLVGWKSTGLFYFQGYGVETEDSETLPVPAESLELTSAGNPFRSSVTIAATGSSLPDRLQVFDLQGRLIRNLQASGGNNFFWDGRGSDVEAPAGAYIVRGTAGESTASLMVVKLR